MMSLFHSIPFRRILPGFLLLLFAFSCRQEDYSIELPTPARPGSGETAEVTLSIRISDFRAANTRAGIGEDLVNEITILLFAEESGTEVVKMKTDHSLGIWTSIDSSGKWINVPVIAGTYKRMAIVANASTELSAIVVGSTYNDLKQVEATGKYGQRMESWPPDTRIPMYGEYAPTGGIQFRPGVSQVIEQEISLIRMMARVDIVNNSATSGAATVGPIFFVNPVGNGRVWVNPTSYNTTASQSGYMAPTLPATLLPANFSDPLLVTGNTTSHNVMTYYLNEQPATSPVLVTWGNNRPCIVIALRYQGREYYYRMDYTWDGVKGGGVAPYRKGDYMPILRNHRYIFTIKEVLGPGYSSIDEAVNAPENFTNPNIVVVPIVIDEAFTDITFNSLGYFLAVTRTEMTLLGAHGTTSTQNKFSVRTNSPGGFRVTAYDSDGTQLLPSASPWLLSNPSSGASGATLSNPINQEVQAITSGGGSRDGYLEVRAGRLYTKVNVSQR